LRNIDFSSWQSLVATLFGLAVVTLIGVGIRLLMMLTIQQRRERMNRQINERLRLLISAYKTLGGSFTGDLAVDPAHLRDLRQRSAPGAEGGPAVADAAPGAALGAVPAAVPVADKSDRSRRIRDAVEGALSDIILLGTEEHVRLAERAARELIAGRTVHTHELVVALRSFIRRALDLDPIPSDLAIPMQGPTRPGSSGRGKEEGRQSGNKGGGDKGGGMGMGMGAGMGVGVGLGGDDPHDHHS
jgi:hypothetical protein